MNAEERVIEAARVWRKAMKDKARKGLFLAEGELLDAVAALPKDVDE